MSGIQRASDVLSRGFLLQPDCLAVPIRNGFSSPEYVGLASANPAPASDHVPFSVYLPSILTPSPRPVSKAGSLSAMTSLVWGSLHIGACVFQHRNKERQDVALRVHVLDSLEHRSPLPLPTIGFLFKVAPVALPECYVAPC